MNGRHEKKLVICSKWLNADVYPYPFQTLWFMAGQDICAAVVPNTIWSVQAETTQHDLNRLTLASRMEPKKKQTNKIVRTHIWFMVRQRSFLEYQKAEIA